MRTPEEIEFQMAIEKVAQHIVEESEDVRTEVEMLLVDTWVANQESFFRAYYDIINSEDEGDL